MNDRDLIDLVLNFTQQINELQVKYYPLTQDSSQDTSVLFANYKAEAEKIYLRYLTKKDRTYYIGINSPPKFAGVKSNTPSKVEHKKNGAVVTFYTNTGLLDFQFILTCKNDQWLINSFKQRYHSDDRELTYKWQYGSF